MKKRFYSLFAFILCISILLVSCNNGNQPNTPSDQPSDASTDAPTSDASNVPTMSPSSDQATQPEPSPDAPVGTYTIHYYLKDGGAYVSHIEFSEGAKNLTVEIPATVEDGASDRVPAGTPVVGINPRYFACQNVPDCYIYDSLFVEHIQKPLEKAVEDGRMDNFYYEMVKASFRHRSLSTCHTQKQKDELLQKYPIITETDIWEFVGFGSSEDELYLRTYVSFYLSEYASYTAEDYAADQEVMKDLVAIFSNTDPIRELILPDSITELQAGTFAGLCNLEKVTLPNNLKSVGAYTFAACPKLTEITIPEGVTSIGENTFQYCNDLAKISLPQTLESIGENAFESCSSLIEITVPDGVTSIGENAFWSCNNLHTVYYTGSETEWAAISGLDTSSLPENIQIIYNYEGSLIT